MLDHSTNPDHTARDPLVAAGAALAFAFGFAARNPLAILRRVGAPATLGCVALYSLIWSYCSQLVNYLDFPSDALAGRIMGIAGLSILFMPLLHAIVVSRLAELVTGDRSEEPSFLGIRTGAWRIYVAELRLVLTLGIFGVLALGASSLMIRAGVAPNIKMAFGAAAWLLLFWLAARFWFFLVPVSLQAKGENALMQSWRLSRGHFVSISAVMLSQLVLMLLLLGGGEYLLRSVGVLTGMPATMTFINAISLYQRNLWPLVILVSVVYLYGASLMTAACIKLHRELVEEAFAAPAA